MESFHERQSLCLPVSEGVQKPNFNRSQLKDTEGLTHPLMPFSNFPLAHSQCFKGLLLFPWSWTQVTLGCFLYCNNKELHLSYSLSLGSSFVSFWQWLELQVAFKGYCPICNAWAPRETKLSPVFLSFSWDTSPLPIPGSPSRFSDWCFMGQSKRHIFLSYHLEPALLNLRLLETQASLSRWMIPGTDSLIPFPIHKCMGHLYSLTTVKWLPIIHGVRIQTTGIAEYRNLSAIFILDKRGW